MAKKSTTDTRARAALDALFDDAQNEVNVKGQIIPLTPPSRAQVVSLLTWVEENRDAVSKDKEGNFAVNVDKGTELIAKTIHICIPSLKGEDEAFRLFNRAGGQNSELAQRCLELCGVDGDSISDAVEADPTHSTSPE